MINTTEDLKGSNTFELFVMCVGARKHKLGYFTCLDSLLDAHWELESEIENFL